MIDQSLNTSQYFPVYTSTIDRNLLRDLKFSSLFTSLNSFFVFMIVLTLLTSSDVTLTQGFMVQTMIIIQKTKIDPRVFINNIHFINVIVVLVTDIVRKLVYMVN